MSDVVLKTNKLSKHYGEFRALDEVSITVNKGDIYGLIGKNGTGKTTFFKTVMGLAKATSGEIFLNNSTENLEEARSKVGFMISPSFFPHMNPQQSLKYTVKAKGLNVTDSEVVSVLELVGLHKVKKPFKSFSLGMKQRLGIANALLGNPSLIILDEPINGLDPQGIIDIRNTILQVQESLGTTFIISSHILAELDLIADKFGFIDSGRLLKEISANQLHSETQRSLAIKADDPAKACKVLTDVAKVSKEDIEVHQLAVDDYTIMLSQNYVEHSGWINHLLVVNGVNVLDLHRKETTLEEYFIKLVEDSRIEMNLSEVELKNRISDARPRQLQTVNK